jgi:hypothetical protein
MTLGQTTTGRDLREDLGRVRPEHRVNVGVRLMYRFDQRRDPWRDYEQVLRLFAAGIPIRMRRAPPCEHRRARPRLHPLAAEPEPERSSEHVPRLVVLVMDVHRSDPVISDLGGPLHDHEIVAGTAEPTAQPRRHCRSLRDAQPRYLAPRG